jgi:hypothetical protein
MGTVTGRNFLQYLPEPDEWSARLTNWHKQYAYIH